MESQRSLKQKRETGVRSRCDVMLGLVAVLLALKVEEGPQAKEYG